MVLKTRLCQWISSQSKLMASKWCILRKFSFDFASPISYVDQGKNPHLYTKTIAERLETQVEATEQKLAVFEVFFANIAKTPWTVY